MILCFFFQAEDGIRYYKVTGVQTCALPIWDTCRSAQVLHVYVIDRQTGKNRRPSQIGRASCRERVQVAVVVVSVIEQQEEFDCVLQQQHLEYDDTQMRPRLVLSDTCVQLIQ